MGDRRRSATGHPSSNGNGQRAIGRPKVLLIEGELAYLAGVIDQVGVGEVFVLLVPLALAAVLVQRIVRATVRRELERDRERQPPAV